MGHIHYTCGCVNERIGPLEILHSVSKCGHHQQESGKCGLSHYVEMGAISHGIPQHAGYCHQMAESLVMADASVSRARHQNSRAVEIGAGLAMYAPMFMARGFKYEAIEPDEEAALWVRSTFDVVVWQDTFETIEPHFDDGSVEAVMAAHVFEHMVDPFTVLARVHRILSPGGRLYGIVPDDLDPLNPDHLWFFNRQSIIAAIEQAGFVNVKTIVRRVIARENFIYFAAERQS